LDFENIPAPKLTSYDTVMSRVTTLDDLRMTPEKTSSRARGLTSDEDLGLDVMSIAKLNFTSAGSVQVPGHGLLRMTPWAQRQLGNQIGVRWNKFFGDQDADRINRAVRDHLRVREEPPVMRIVAREHVKGDNSGTDGLLRGFVSPTYTELRDARLLDRMRTVVGRPQLKDMGFTKFDLRDNGSHYTLVYSEPVELTPGRYAADNFRGFDGHERPDRDVGYVGLRLRNSEVGAYSYTADAYAMRLVCINGMMVLVEGERVMKRRHVGLTDDDKLDEIIDNTFQALPKLRETIVARNKALRALDVPDPESEIRAFLGRKKQPKTLIEAVIGAYDDEPEATAYGVLQAITRTSAALHDVPDRQHEMELLAGEYMEQQSKKVA